jgi:hypothetical protein
MPLKKKYLDKLSIISCHCKVAATRVVKDKYKDITAVMVMALVAGDYLERHNLGSWRRAELIKLVFGRVDITYLVEMGYLIKDRHKFRNSHKGYSVVRYYVRCLTNATFNEGGGYHK